MNKILIAFSIVVLAINVSLAQNQDSTIKADTSKIIEVMPEFPGKEAGILQYIKRNLKYPEEAAKKHVEGIVYVSYVVDKDGKVRDSKILKGIGAGCDEEALRLINAMPDWKPGTQNGRPVAVQYNLPVKFSLK